MSEFRKLEADPNQYYHHHFDNLDQDKTLYVTNTSLFLVPPSGIVEWNVPIKSEFLLSPCLPCPPSLLALLALLALPFSPSLLSSSSPPPFCSF
jgi:hypothetical protein